MASATNPVGNAVNVYPTTSGAIGDPRRFTTVRHLQSFQQPGGSVLCGVRGRERPTTTRPTQTSRWSGFGVEELADIRQAVTSTAKEEGFDPSSVPRNTTGRHCNVHHISQVPLRHHTTRDSFFGVDSLRRARIWVQSAINAFYEDKEDSKPKNRKTQFENVFRRNIFCEC